MNQRSFFEPEKPEVSDSRVVPLAARMRPRTFDELVGQQEIVGPGLPLRTAIERDRLSSVILWGPPGSGKTTLATIIAGVTGAQFHHLSAVTSGVADVRKVIDKARSMLALHRRRTILLIDEIHRFSKSQQDAVLQAVEEGTITLVGATTENPSFEVNAALLSRCRVFTLRQLTDAEVEVVVRRALADPDRGVAHLNVDLAGDAMTALCGMANGDARVALNALELAAEAATADERGRKIVRLDAISDVMQRRALLYDRAGEYHYDTISAFIKSVRGSDPDAAVYWLARMLEAGEDPLFVARRLVILAAEDIGLADPNALPMAVAAYQATHFLGMPEASLPLSEATIYLAAAEKSNSSLKAYTSARAVVDRTRNDPVPLHLRNAATGLMAHLGYGRDYQYSHNYAADDPNRFEQRYLPANIDAEFYVPGLAGAEVEIAERVRKARRLRTSADAGRHRPNPGRRSETSPREGPGS